MSSYDDLDPDLIPTTRRTRARKNDSPKRRRFDDETAQARRGRLTKEERGQLAALRETTVQEPLPDGADRWSTWDSHEHGPRPRPPWLVTELGAVDHDLGVLKSGKEATVHLLRRSVPGSDRSCLLASKRYRDSDHRLFHRDAGYLEGRRMRRSRENRAMAQRTAFGRGMIAQQWAVAEFQALCDLWSSGAPVPYPVQRVGNEVLLEFVGTADGEAAPRLAGLRPDADELDELWSQLVNGLLDLAERGLSHGDLSAYNLLVQADVSSTGEHSIGKLVLIDLPQVVDLVANPTAATFLERDVRNITHWFRTRGLPDERADPDALVRVLRETAGLA